MFKKDSNEKIIEVNPDILETHPIADMHPEMTDEEFLSLKMSIEENGQLVPVLLYRDRLVDGRHRLKAIRYLRIPTIKAIELNRKLSLDEVKERVFGTERKRNMTTAQKAIQAYWYMNNHEDCTQEYVATKFGISRSEVSRAKKIEQMLGSDILKELFERGKTFIGGKQYGTLQKIIKAVELSKKAKQEIEYDDMSETAKAAIEAINNLAAQNKTLELEKIRIYLRNEQERLQEQ